MRLRADHPTAPPRHTAEGLRAPPSVLRGVLAACLCFAAFTAADTTIKALSASHAPVQSLAIATLFAFVPALIWIAATGRFGEIRPKTAGLTWLRALLITCSTIAIVSSLAFLPLADAYAIIFIAPLLTTALAGPLLGERVGLRRWMAVLAGFVGMLVILRPGFQAFSLGHALALASALFFSMGSLLIRHIGPREGPAALILTLLFTTSVLALALALPVWQPLSLEALGVMAVSGFFAGAGHTLLVIAFHAAPAPVVAPFQYTQLVWGMILGLVLFADIPEPIMLAGAALVVASGLYILLHERSAGRRRQTS